MQHIKLHQARTENKIIYNEVRGANRVKNGMKTNSEDVLCGACTIEATPAGGCGTDTCLQGRVVVWYHS